MGPEAKLQKKIMAYLKAIPNAVFFKVSQGKYSSHGVSDIIGCIDGQFYAFEVKAEDGKLTPLQKIFLGKVFDAGGIIACARSLDEVKAIIEGLTPTSD